MLWHVDINSQWLGQGVQHGSIHIHWMPTKKIVASDLTKAVSSTPKHQFVVRMTTIEVQKNLLASIKREAEALQ